MSQPVLCSCHRKNPNPGDVTLFSVFSSGSSFFLNLTVTLKFLHNPPPSSNLSLTSSATPPNFHFLIPPPFPSFPLLYPYWPSLLSLNSKDILHQSLAWLFSAIRLLFLQIPAWLIVSLLSGLPECFPHGEACLRCHTFPIPAPLLGSGWWILVRIWQLHANL